MLLGALVDDFVTLRTASGLLLSPGDVLSCAIEAARLYAGWAEFEDISATTLELITAGTDLTAGEWALIGPLFRLYVEREMAVVVEFSRGTGVEPSGRSSSEVASEIQQYELTLPQLAYVEPVFAVGLPVV